MFNLCFSVCDINFGHLRIQYSVPISIQESVDYSLPPLTLCFLPQNTSISSFPLIFPIQFCESLWVSGLWRTLWEQITAQICLSPLESPFLSSCSPLSPSSLSYSSCNSVNLFGCPSQWIIFSPLTQKFYYQCCIVGEVLRLLEE